MTASRQTASPATGNSRHIALEVTAAHLARIGLALLYAPLRLLPRRHKVVMLSRQHATTPADFADLAAALRRTDPGLRIVIDARMVPGGLTGKVRYGAHLVRQLYHVATARVLVLDSYSMIASLLHHGRGLTIVQMWHSMGLLKRMGLSIIGTAEGRDPRLARAMRMHRGYSIILASGPDCRPALAEGFGADPDRVVVAPLPRVDHLIDPAERQATRQRLLARHPQLAGRRLAVYAPTLRLDEHRPVDTVALGDALAALGLQLVVKTHPLMPTPDGAVETAAGFTTAEVLQAAELCITDYSSVMYEAAVIGVPVQFLAPDLDEYLADRGFYIDYRHDLPGPVSRTIPELVAAISTRLDGPDAERARAEIAAFAHRWVQVPEHRAEAGARPCADRIAQIVAGAAGRDGHDRPR